MKKNQIITGRCIDYTYDGFGVVKYDTFTIFVKDIIIDEIAQIIITFVRKNFAYGKIIELIQKSQQRIEATCPLSKICGGCQLQHMTYIHQLEFKKKHVEDVIKNIGKIDFKVNNVLPSTHQFSYRNKVIYPVDIDRNGQLQIGFYRYNSHDVIDCHYCYLQSERANQLIAIIRTLIVEEHLEKDIRYIMLRDMDKSQQIMVVFITYQKVNLENLVKKIIATSDNVKSIYQIINNTTSNVILEKEHYLLWGQKYIEDELCGLRFKINPYSFYQVNSYQTEILYNTAIELANINAQDNVLDLYCGVGTIGMVASKKAKSVVGVEIVAQAIEDAKKNAKANNIANIEFICNDAKIAAKELLEKGRHFDCVLVDPPRKGCSSEMLETLVSFAAERIVYISCNPATLARDLNYLKEKYCIKQIQPVDMFSNTYHIETVVLLSNKNVKAKDCVEIGVDVEDY